jgi:meso-butanediol dehydrogenase/(S,S)-butanediol dehydrogenase/diacetyl reductase
MGLLTEKIALVTGGGRGIGRGIVQRFLEEGAKVVIAQRSPLDDELTMNPNIAFKQADLNDNPTLKAIIDYVVDSFSGLDILVNNAGIMFERRLEEMQEDEWHSMMAVNLDAPVFLCKYALPEMIKRGGGSIVNIGSIEGIGSNPLHTAYCASKAAIHGLTRALAVDLGPYNIRCNAIAPGWIRSELSEDYIHRQSDPVAAKKALIKMHPIGRTGEPTDIGDIAVFLCSDKAGFITGQVIVIDGGRTAKLPLPF